MRAQTLTDEIEFLKGLIKETDKMIVDFRGLYKRAITNGWDQVAKETIAVGKGLVNERKGYKQEIKDLMEGSHELFFTKPNR